MRHNNMTLSTSLVCFTLVLCMQALCSAQGTYYSAQSNGLFDPTVNGSTQIATDSEKIVYTSPASTEVWGPMTVTGPAIYASATTQSATFNWVTMFGRKVQHAVLTSAPFYYTDYTTYLSYTATMKVTLTQTGTFGQGGYQIINAANGKVITETKLNGVYAEVPFTYGYVAITE